MLQTAYCISNQSNGLASVNANVTCLTMPYMHITTSSKPLPPSLPISQINTLHLLQQRPSTILWPRYRRCHAVTLRYGDLRRHGRPIPLSLIASRAARGISIFSFAHKIDSMASR